MADFLRTDDVAEADRFARVVLVPEGRRLFPSLTAEENILIPVGARGRREAGPWTLDALITAYFGVHATPSGTDADGPTPPTPPVVQT